MKILILNWRDTENPAGGGAEAYTEEIAKRLVKLGSQVTIFASSFKGCEPETERFGMRILRQGGKYGVYLKARRYAKEHVDEFDLLVDEINTVPFRIYGVAKKKPVLALIHQLAREIWFYESRFPINVVGYRVLEPIWLRGYRHIPTVTVSESTRDDLVKLGFENVTIIRNGLNVTPVEALPEKSDHPVLIFLGRLVRSKLPDHAILAFRKIRESLPTAELWILGDGYFRKQLEKKKVDGVTFLGKVNHDEKVDLLKRAHVLLAPSVREGWGLSVIEANAMGTPAVGYRVPGLQDSIVDGVTGILVKPFDPIAMAEGATKILSNPSQANEFSKNALQWSTKFNWDQSAEQFYSMIRSTVNSSPVVI